MLRDMFLQSYAAIPATVERSLIESIVRKYLASYATDDISGRSALFAEDVHVEEPVGSLPIRGRAALVHFWNQSRDAGWTATNELKRIIINGNEACVIFESVLSVPDQGSITLEVFETLVFDDQGRITRLRAYNDKTCLK